MIESYIQGKNVDGLKEIINKILWKYKKYCNYFAKKSNVNFQFKSNISSQEIDITEPEKHNHDINED